jgi:hypothetical protein
VYAWGEPTKSGVFSADRFPQVVDLHKFGLPIVDQAKFCAARTVVEKKTRRPETNVLGRAVSAHSQVGNAAPSGTVAHY